MTDKQLVDGILTGNKQAEELFYRRFKPRVLAFILQKVSHGSAEELAQDVFISALDSLPGFKSKCQLSSWIMSIARHEIADFYRKKKIKEVVFSRLPFLKKLVSQALSPQVAYEEKELKEKIGRTFGKLSEGYTQILRLKYCDGYSVAQLAQKLKITYKSAESRLFRARLAFQREFEYQSKKSYQIRDLIGSS